MSKKNKRQVRKVSTAPLSSLPSSRPEEQMPLDYSHVIRDLKRIGLLAGSFFVILIVLSFILR